MSAVDDRSTGEPPVVIEPDPVEIGTTEPTALLEPSGNEAGTAPEDRAFRPDIEGLRAVAVGLVVLDHALGGAFPGGFIGVDVFFVISGYVITGLLLRERQTEGRIKLLGFYARRARRILPAAVLVLVVTLVAERLLIGGPILSTIAAEARWASVFLANFSHAQAAVFQPAPFGAYWSLAVEEQFYVFYPALFIGVCLLGRRWPLRARLATFLGVVILTSFTWSVVSSPSSLYAYVSPLTRAWELAVGALLAVGASRLRQIPGSLAAIMTWCGLLVLVILGRTFHPTASGYPGWRAIFPVFAAVLVVGGGTTAPRHGAESLLRSVPFKWIGRWPTRSTSGTCRS